jgi:hypothetical protein
MAVGGEMGKATPRVRGGVHEREGVNGCSCVLLGRIKRKTML